MKITTIRHGETDWNRARRPQGSRDIPLNAQGIVQAKCLATRLAQEPCDIIYTSDLSRASETATQINVYHQVNIVRTDQLRENSFGPFEGQVVDDPETLAAFVSFMDAHAPAYYARLQTYLTELLSCGHEHVFIVAHFGTIRGIICGLLGLDVSEREQFYIGNTAIHVFEQQNDGSFVMTIENDTQHLRNLKTT